MPDFFFIYGEKRKRARVKNKLLHAYFIFGKDVNIVARKKQRDSGMRTE